jgi:hypothetical protein
MGGLLWLRPSSPFSNLIYFKAEVAAHTISGQKAFANRQKTAVLSDI